MESFKDKSLYIRFIIYFFELYVFYSLEQSTFLNIGEFAAKPLLVVIGFSTIAVFENEFVGMIFGVVSGIFLDMIFGVPIGLCAMLLCFLGYVIGVITTYFIKPNLLVFWSISTVTVFVVLLLRFLFFYVLKNVTGLEFILEKIFLPIMIYSVIIAPIVFWFNRCIYFSKNTGGEKNKKVNNF